MSGSSTRRSSPHDRSLDKCVRFDGRHASRADSPAPRGLHQERGDREKAGHYLGRFVDLWQEADPDLQPQVAVVRLRLARLSGEPAAR